MQNGVCFGVNKGSFSGYAKQNPPFSRFSKSIGGISPSIEAIFNANYKLSGIFPSIYLIGCLT